jgi:hypothetical protein
MNILIQLRQGKITENLSQDHSIRSLGIFSLQKSFYNKESKTFVHYLTVIGYAGGGSQGELFCKILGSNLEKSTIYISIFADSMYYEYLFKSDVLKIINYDNDLNESDLVIQNEFIEEINNYLSWDDTDGYYYIKNKSLLLEENFFMSQKYPLRMLKYLKNVYWPFSISW